MGIQGLLPQLKSIMVPIHIKDLEGCSVAIDTYSWLHKGALSCSRELCKGQPTSKHINYCMHRVNLLRHHGVRPILVFDGGHLPMKMEQENKRARSRKENLARAIEHESVGNSTAAYECYQKAVDISSSIAYELIKVLKKENVSFVVAPYEADAQMTFLAVSKQVDAVITEDSDLIPFGCPRIIYKMDKFGQGVEFCSSTLQQNKELNFTGFNKQMFLEMCILSGCDYLQSLPGMGLKKAHALIKKFKSYDKVIKHLKFSSVAVPPLYEESFTKAILTFQHQRVYNPILEVIVHLSDLSDNVGEGMDFLGPSIPQDIAKGIATGDLDPFTKIRFQGECVRGDALVLDETYQPRSIKHENETKKIDLPVQKNLLTNYFCFTSLEAKKKFRLPRVTPKQQSSLRSDPGEEMNDTATSFIINCSPHTPTLSRDLDIVDPSNTHVYNGVATKSSASLELLAHGVDDMEDDLRSPQPSLPHRSRHAIHPCMVVSKERRCNFSSDTGEGETILDPKNVTFRSSYFQHKPMHEDCPESNTGKLWVKDVDSTGRCMDNISEFEFKSSIGTCKGEVKLEDMTPLLRRSTFQIKSAKTINQENAHGTLLVKNSTGEDIHRNGSSILNLECKPASNAAQQKTRSETRKVIVRSSYFQKTTGKENDHGKKVGKLEDNYVTEACESSCPDNTTGSNYFKGRTKRKFSPDDNVQTEHFNPTCSQSNGPAHIQSYGITNSDDSMIETKDEQDKFGCNISHLGQYSNIAEKSIEKFASVISSFRCASGSRASGLRAPLKDVRNTSTNSGRLAESTDLSKFAYVPTKRKSFSVRR